MKLLPDGRYEIINKKTGEKKIINKEELPRYGLTAPIQEEQPQPQPTNPISKIYQNPLVNFFASPVVNTAKNVGKITELMGGGSQSYAVNPQKYEQLPDLLKNFVYSPNEVQQKFSGDTLGQRLVKGVKEGERVAADVGMYALPVDKWIAGIGKKVAGPLSEIGISKFITPGKLQKGLGEALNKVGGTLERYLVGTEGKIEVKPVVNSLMKVQQELVDKGLPKELAEKNIGKIISRVASKGESISAEEAHNIVRGFYEDIYGEAGKELSKRGIVGKGIKKAEKMSAGQLTTQIKLALKKEGYEDGLKAFEMFRKLGIISKEMEQPFKNWWKGGLVGAIASGVGSTSAGALGAGTALMSMPYTRVGLQKAFSLMFAKVPQAIGKFGTIKTLDELLNKENK